MLISWFFFLACLDRVLIVSDITLFHFRHTYVSPAVAVYHWIFLLCRLLHLVLDKWWHKSSNRLCKKTCLTTKYPCLNSFLYWEARVIELWPICPLRAAVVDDVSNRIAEAATWNVVWNHDISCQCMRVRPLLLYFLFTFALVLKMPQPVAAAADQSCSQNLKPHSSCKTHPFTPACTRLQRLTADYLHFPPDHW